MENSSICKALFSHERTKSVGHDDDDESPEESTWTMYFEDFFSDTINGDDQTHNEDSSYSYSSSSLISDAASFVGNQKIPQNERFMISKKRKTKEASLVGNGIELLDTASSPSHSPKVYSMMDLLGKNPNEKDGRKVSQEKGDASRQIDEKTDEMGFPGRDGDSLPLDLKEKGLCLVPASMVAKYFGH